MLTPVFEVHEKWVRQQDGGAVLSRWRKRLREGVSVCYNAQTNGHKASVSVGASEREQVSKGIDL